VGDGHFNAGGKRRWPVAEKKDTLRKNRQGTRDISKVWLPQSSKGKKKGWRLVSSRKNPDKTPNQLERIGGDYWGRMGREGITTPRLARAGKLTIACGRQVQTSHDNGRRTVKGIGR